MLVGWLVGWFVVYEVDDDDGDDDDDVVVVAAGVVVVVGGGGGGALVVRVVVVPVVIVALVCLTPSTLEGSGAFPTKFTIIEMEKQKESDVRCQIN